MAIALVTTATQVNVAASSTTAPSIAITVTGGNAMTAFGSIYDSNTTWTLDTVTDGGNAFTLRQGDTGSASGLSKAAVAHAVNVAGGARTVAFNLGGSAAGANRYYVLGCLEWSGVATSLAEDT